MVSIKEDQKVIFFAASTPTIFLNMTDLWSFIDIYGTIHSVYIDLEHSKRPMTVTEPLFCKTQTFFPLYKL